ncbi:MAG TPA: FmdE family protein [Anaerolineales bacterium]
MSENALADLLAASSERHSHLCPRQVLGVRIGLAGAAALHLNLARQDRRLLVILETDGCFADGIEVATGCTVGHRTLRVEDYGKIAATFVDVSTGLAFRIAPQLDVRQKAWEYARGETRHYFAQLLAYQSMPGEELLSIQPVCLKVPIQQILSHAGSRVHCERCGEEIINERVTVVKAHNLCRACASGGYYAALDVSLELANASHAAVIDPL